MSRWGQHVRSRLLAGAFFLLPAVISLWLIAFIFHAVDEALTAKVLELMSPGRVPGEGTVWATRAIALVVVLLVLYLVGLVATNVVGRRLLAAAELGIERIPVIGGIYRAFRQLLDGFGPGGRSAFRRPVLIEYPRPGTWRVAFVTNERTQPIGTPPVPHIAVFVPMTPNPTSGFLVFIPPGECRPLGISTEDGLKLIVSGGIVMPDLWTATPRWSPVPPNADPPPAPLEEP